VLWCCCYRYKYAVLSSASSVFVLVRRICTCTRKTGMCACSVQGALGVVSETMQMVSVICKRRQTMVQRAFVQCRLLLLIDGPYVLG
jgi:hypothetical protein